MSTTKIDRVNIIEMRMIQFWRAVTSVFLSSGVVENILNCPAEVGPGFQILAFDRHLRSGETRDCGSANNESWPPT